MVIVQGICLKRSDLFPLWENHPKHTPLTRLTLHLNPAAQCLDEVIGNIQAQAGAFCGGFGRKKRVKQLVPGFFVHPTTIVLHFNEQIVLRGLVQGHVEVYPGILFIPLAQINLPM